MSNAAVFKYVKDQYQIGKFTAENLVTLVARKVITEEQRLEIIGA